MATDPSAKATAPDHTAGLTRAASEIGAMVAEQVRQLIAHAERAAEQVHRQAVEHASADREAVRRTAIQVSSDIEALEAKVTRTLRALREEAMQIAADMDGHAAAAPPSESEPEAERSSTRERAPSAEGEAEPPAQPMEAADDAEPVSGQVDHPPEEDRRAEAPAEDIEEAQPVPRPSDQAVEAESPAGGGEDGDAMTEPAAPEAPQPAASEAPQPAASEAAQPDTTQDAPTGEPVTAAPEPAPAHASTDVREAPDRRAAPRRGGLLGRLRRGAPPTCAVCARVAAPDEDVAHWRRTRNLSVCPACQAEGWQLPDRGSVPYRSTYQPESR